MGKLLSTFLLVSAAAAALSLVLKDGAKAPPFVPNEDTPDGGYGAMPDAAAVARNKAAAEVIKQAAQKAIGRTLTPYELLYVQGVCKYETGYGQGWTGACLGSNNWGSVHALPGQSGCDWTDSHADETRYAQRMRTYPTPVDGAADVVKRVIKNSKVDEALKLPGASLWRASLAMRRNMYYGSWCKEAVKAHGKDAAKTSANRNPKTVGERACEKEAVSLHVWRMKKEVGAIAPSLGLPTIPEGTYEDAVKWYEGRVGV